MHSLTVIVQRNKETAAELGVCPVCGSGDVQFVGWQSELVTCNTHRNKLGIQERFLKDRLVKRDA